MTDPSFPITRAADLDLLDFDEVLEGYFDGLNGEPKPNMTGNRSLSYIHGWHTGSVDGGHIEKPDWIAALARDVLSAPPVAACDCAPMEG